jgi:hypothetical protein
MNIFKKPTRKEIINRVHGRIVTGAFAKKENNQFRSFFGVLVNEDRDGENLITVQDFRIRNGNKFRRFNLKQKFIIRTGNDLFQN